MTVYIDDSGTAPEQSVAIATGSRFCWSEVSKWVLENQK
jgi:hypothetical protein